jgi:hypothetical protein
LRLRIFGSKVRCPKEPDRSADWTIRDVPLVKPENLRPMAIIVAELDDKKTKNGASKLR